MNRFDDKPGWYFFEKLVGPLLAAVLTGAGLWLKMETRITTVEIKQEGLHDDVVDMKRDIKEILRRVR